jgi:hypothetical protein
MGSCCLFSLKKVVPWVRTRASVGCSPRSLGGVWYPFKGLNRAGCSLLVLPLGMFPLHILALAVFTQPWGAVLHLSPGLLWGRDRSLGQGASIAPEPLRIVADRSGGLSSLFVVPHASVHEMDGCELGHAILVR